MLAPLALPTRLSNASYMSMGHMLKDTQTFIVFITRTMLSIAKPRVLSPC